MNGRVGDALEAGADRPSDSRASHSFFQDAYDFVDRHPVASAVTVGVFGAGAYAASRYIPYAITQRALAAAAKTLNPEDVRIVPMTAESLPAAIEAGKDGFRYGMGFLNPAVDFKSALTPMATKMHAGQKEMNARYFLAVDKENRVLGTTGLYETAKDRGEALWLGWMSVRPAYRGKGIGQRLLDFSIEEAKKSNVDYLRLYTSTYRGEAAAQPLYERVGLKVVGEMKHELPLPGLKYLFREMPLKPSKAASA
ncbi:MAG: GNAT family N-acetyltransferase [Candidatus Obscuribacterales bacterium]|nr:GNAT family N-acetyltransferase [Candidatus Obscuribacterales bacterium]